MSTIVIWVIGAGLLLINIMLRTRILHLEAQLKRINNKDYLVYLRQQKTDGQIAAIKALRKKYPELSLIDAKKLWEQV